MYTLPWQTGTPKDHKDYRVSIDLSTCFLLGLLFSFSSSGSVQLFVEMTNHFKVPVVRWSLFFGHCVSRWIDFKPQTESLQVTCGKMKEELLRTCFKDCCVSRVSTWGWGCATGALETLWNLELGLLGVFRFLVTFGGRLYIFLHPSEFLEIVLHPQTNWWTPILPQNSRHPLFLKDTDRVPRRN